MKGHIWHAGWEAGDLHACLFDDVPPALAQWHSQGIKVYIYSSGSRAAQADLFSHTQQGDMRQYLSGFFDTSSGPKVHHLCLGYGHCAAYHTSPQRFSSFGKSFLARSGVTMLAVGHCVLLLIHACESLALTFTISG